MVFNEDLADRVRTLLVEVPSVSERMMFGGLAFLVSGRMACDEAHVRPMDCSGKPMRSMVFVQPAGIATERALQEWVQRAIAHALTLPPKGR